MMRKFGTMITAIAITSVIAGTPMQVQAAEEFDPIFYSAMYEDVATVFGTDAEALYNHYITFGQKEGRIPYVGANGGEIVEGIKDSTINTFSPTDTNNDPINPVCAANGHTWVTTTETVHYPALGHMERTEKKIITIQCGCGFTTQSDDEFDRHCIAEGHGDYPCGSITKTTHEDNWVVTQEAFDEVVTKSVCGVCGLTQ